jgi:hypothetical protein
LQSNGEWVRVSALAQRLGLSSQAVRDLIRAGKLKGTKDPEGRWLIEAESAEAYAATHARGKADGAADIARIEKKLDELATSVSSLRQENPLATRLLETTERERDKHRADAAAVRETALRLAASAQETHVAVSGLLNVLRGQQEALIQLLAPGSPADLFTPTTRND